MAGKYSMQKFILTVSLLLILTNTALPQLKENEKFHSFSGTLALSVEAVYTSGKTDYLNSESGLGARGMMEYFLPAYTNHIFGLRLFIGGHTLRGNDKSKSLPSFKTDMFVLGIGASYSYAIEEKFFPYLYGGFSSLWFDPKDDRSMKAPNNAAGLYDLQTMSYDGEVGFRFTMVENVNLQASFGYHLVPTDFLDDIAAGVNDDGYFSGSIGLSFSFFAKKDSDGDGVDDSQDLCPDTPAGVKVDIFGCPVDTDGDGVPDYLDNCPDTPKGVEVDKKGCPVDSDRDGVPNYLDDCPDTPSGVEVDDYGCPIDSDNDGVPDFLDKCPNTPEDVSVDAFGCPRDSDGDGVPDYLDKCPGTPENVPVDSDGCPPDSDKDGVPDYLDKCPDTPANVRVDADGCPVDTDRDGVPDYLDKCPNTPLGTQVDENGCPIQRSTTQPRVTVPTPPVKTDVTKPKVDTPGLDQAPKVFSLLGVLTFEDDKADIKPSGYVELNRIYQAIKDYPSAKWRIEGHMDNQGSEFHLQALSTARAKEVMNFFISKGMQASQFEVIGYGSKHPIESNEKPYGRSKNRRVVIQRIN
jgi:outer membrane protein OmpA-like peptidoglycan-associated protein